MSKALATVVGAEESRLRITLSFSEFLVAVAIDAVLASLVFRHAHRRQNGHATAWGVFTFLAAGLAIPVYFITYWLRMHRA